MDIAALQAKVAAAAPMPFTEAPAPVKGLSANVDGDYLAYYCAGNDDTNPGDARRNVMQRLDRVKFVTGATRVVVHLSTDNCTKGDRFHVAVQKPYQGQRTSGRKPVNWRHLRDFMSEYNGPAFTVKQWSEREADDGMAYVCNAMAVLKNQLHVVHTADKDMRMFAGKHVIWKTYQVVDVPLGTYELIGPDEEIYGHKWFWMQMLTGDTADNIPGLHRVGEVKAAEVLRGTTCNHEAAEAVRGMYMGHHGGEWADVLVEQAALLWMRTDRLAAIDDFMSLDCFGDEVKRAVGRMKHRVNESKNYLRELAS